ncbi:hypothetical protein [Dyella lipolytica]|uniref:Uncharacterized protein n=1 Tax=Dyella lipolytica TaxID=1867835 RepID=A0ABW8IWM2_9GAMM|nr:hypothetical protein [Dyella lipolytica]
MLVPVLITGVAGAAGSTPSANGAGGSTPPADARKDDSSYFSQHFSTDALGSDIKDAVVRANLAAVSFKKIVVHTHDQLTATGQTKPGSYDVAITLENAGSGLVRRMETVQHDGTMTVARFDLTYRGYFSFLTQSVPANAGALPPIVEARKVIRFDTNTDGHMNFTYLYGSTGKPTFSDPGQVVCDSGKSYSASSLNQAIEGQAHELDCQFVDTNGIVTDKMKLAYLEKYGVALMLHLQNADSTIDSSIVDFNVE